MKTLQILVKLSLLVLVIVGSSLKITYASDEQHTSFIPALALSQSTYPAVLISFEEHSNASKTVDISPLLNSNSFKTGTVNFDVVERNSPHVYIDFFIEGIRTDMTMDIFLAVSTRPGSRDSWPLSRVGQLMLDPQTLTILAKINSYDLVNYWPNETELGPVGVLMSPEEIKSENTKNSDWIRVSVNIAGLLDSPRLRFVDKLYFQALTAPMGTIDFEHSQSSNISYFIIEGR